MNEVQIRIENFKKFYFLLAPYRTAKSTICLVFNYLRLLTIIIFISDDLLLLKNLI